uniref:Variant surface glycoprotein 1125.5790 n=1 Tax=Trypanosoma brucei TaxID=5691 RepID=A0A1J0RDE2_9TRYP|nr:variant surface glycoprotein 1125.5790 [Trypanosoma brucei]
MNGQANALVVALFLATNQVSPETTADDSALEFRALCQFVNMATAGIKAALAPQIDKAEAAYIGALNLTLADNTIEAAIDEVKPWEQLGKPQQQTLSWRSDYYEYWQASKKQITAHKSTIDIWTPKKITPQLRAKVEELASKAKAIYEQRAASYTITEPVDQLINRVLYGKAQPITTGKIHTASSREAVCSSRASTQQSEAGNALLLDLLCLCSFDGSNIATKKLVAGTWTLPQRTQGRTPALAVKQRQKT